MICLVLALGVTATLFNFIDSVFFRRLPLPQSDRLVAVHRDGAPSTTWSRYNTFTQTLTTFVPVATISASTLVDVDQLNLRFAMEIVSDNYADVLQVHPFAGHWLDRPTSGTNSAVISYDLWVSTFNKDRAVIGKRILIQERPFVIVGIAPQGFHGTQPPLLMDLWVPISALLNPREARNAYAPVNILGRLTPGNTMERAAAELRVADAREQENEAGNLKLPPAQLKELAGFTWENTRQNVTPVVTIITIVSAVILLIACINVSILQLSRAAARRTEIALRRSLGASTSRLFRESITDNLVLVGVATPIGLALGQLIGQAVELALPSIPVAQGLAIHLGIAMRPVVLLIGSAIACAVLISLFQASDRTTGDLVAAMRISSSSPSIGAHRLYPIAQVALSFVLLILTGLLLRESYRAQRKDLGFHTDRRLYATLLASPATTPPALARDTYTRVLGNVRELPGLRAVTLASGVLGPTPGECVALTPEDHRRPAETNVVDPSYFSVMGVPIIAGHGFTEALESRNLDVVVSESAARSWWNTSAPLGKEIWIGCEQSGRQPGHVVGVARDTNSPLPSASAPAFYLSRLQNGGTGGFGLIIHTSGPPYQWSEALRAAIRASAPSLRVYEIRSLDDAIALTLWEVRWESGILAGLGVLALILAALGLYGVLAYSTSRRTQEMGVRMALGADPRTVLWLVLRQSLSYTMIGLAIGLLLAVGATRVLGQFIVGLVPLGPGLAFSTVALWVLIALVATWQPASRAARMDPMTAIRHE
ncbi:MAG: FtsX-like permease family protein [Bryobacteraceae bacterium]